MKLALAIGFTLLSIVSAVARDNVTVTGSSTVFPFTSLAAENYATSYNAASPVVESIGTGAGVKLFCSGVSEETADIVGASRPLKKDEAETCAANNVTPIEVKIGYDGIVFATATNGPDLTIEPSDIYKALAANLVIDGKLVPNPYTNLREINPAFPDWKISFFIPGEKHGTREVFEKEVLEAGCNKEELMAAGVSKDDVSKQCVAVRKDGYISDIDGDYSETLARITADPQSIGVFGFSFFVENTDLIKVAPVEGIVPSLETIASGEYPVSRPLFVYVKKEHVGQIVGLEDYLTELTSDGAIGPDGYLIDIGLIPLPDDERAAVQQVITNLK
jgi:phosphate transport system substrate-binding protein